MADNGIEVFAAFTAKDGHQQELKTVLAAMAEEARSDAGCLRFDLLQNLEDDHDFMFAEMWESVEALADHRAMPYLNGYRDQRAPHLARKPVVRKWVPAD